MQCVTSDLIWKQNKRPQKGNCFAAVSLFVERESIFFWYFGTMYANIRRILKSKGEKLWKIVKLSKWKRKYRQNF